MKRSVYHVMIGRYRDPENPELGRYVKADIKPILRKTHHNVKKLALDVNFSRYRSLGNRLMTLLGVYSLSAYRAMRDSGISQEYALELFGDVGWRLYASGIKLPLSIIRPFTSNPQVRLNFVLRVFLYFPFSEDPAGYQRKHWKEDDRYCTDWTRCVVYDYFKSHGTDGEIEFFRRTWCHYDYAFPRLIHPDGFYERPHTLSNGDDVCDMRWYAKTKNDKA